jgi:1-acyl-sn-glycerol-3-phosphate acyltransferase
MEIAERPVQLRGSAVARVLLRAAGWRVRFDGLPQRQGVVIVYPHTSNWDFVVGILAKWSIGIPVAFWGKASLFRVPPFGRWLGWLGGIAVDRANPSGVVRDTVERLQRAIERDDFLWLAVAPEGTRKYSERWRSGFWHVAVQAGVPLGLAYFDFARRIVSLERFIRLTGDVDRDMHEIAHYLAHRVGFNERQAAPVRMREEQ